MLLAFGISVFGLKGLNVSQMVPLRRMSCLSPLILCIPLRRSCRVSRTFKKQSLLAKLSLMIQILRDIPVTSLSCCHASRKLLMKNAGTLNMAPCMDQLSCSLKLRLTDPCDWIRIKIDLKALMAHIKGGEVCSLQTPSWRAPDDLLLPPELYLERHTIDACFQQHQHVFAVQVRH